MSDWMIGAAILAAYTGYLVASVLYDGYKAHQRSEAKYRREYPDLF